MRMMLKVTIPVEAGNKMVKDGSLARAMQSRADRLKREVSYFLADEAAERRCSSSTCRMSRRFPASPTRGS